MALVTGTHLTTSSSGTPATSFTTASVSPTSNNLVLIAVHSVVGSGTGNIPTVTGAGLTWVEVNHQYRSGVTTILITVLRGLGTVTPGALTIDFAGQTQTQCSWSVNSFANIDTSGSNGSGAIVQSAVNTNTGTTTGLSITLSAFGSANNATYGAINKSGNNAPAAGSGFTELGTDTNTQLIETEWKNTNDTSVDWTWGSESASSEGVAIEIKNVSAAAGSFLPFL